MRILMACTGVGAHGGIQRFNRNLLRAWQDLDANVDVVAVNDDPVPDPDTRSRIRVFGAGRSKARWLLHIARLLVSRRYDYAVCAHIHLAPVFSLMLAFAGVPAARRVLILHGVEVWGRVNGAKRAAACRFGRVLSVSQYTAQRFLEQLQAPSAMRVSVFPNTVGPELPSVPAADSPIAEVRPRIRLLTVARLARTERDKGLLDVLAALARLPGDIAFQLTIIGDGDDRSFLEARARELGIGDRAEFRGALADEDLWTAYAAADVFVLPSRKEGFGIVYLEAMWFGLPVIAAREKGAVEVVRDGENGYLVPFGDPPALTERLIALAADPLLRRQLGARGRSLVHEGGEFSFDSFRERCRRWFFEAPVRAGGT